MASRSPLPLLATLLLTACGGGGGPKEPALPAGPGTLTVPPIALAAVTDLEPLGWLNPPGHTLPTAHVYFYYAWSAPGPLDPPPWPVLPVLAPGPGTVSWILASPGQPDHKVMVRMTSTFQYFLDHVVLDPGIQVGTVVSAGQRLGQTGPASAAVDLGVLNDQVTLAGFANPARYADGGFLHADSPFRHFAEPLRSELRARIRRNAPDKDGRIDFDVPGRLVGNWFHESVALPDSHGPLGWPKQLAFVPDPNEPAKLRVSIGGFGGLRGVWRPSPGDPDPASVSVASGPVALRLLYLDEAFPARSGLMMVEMLAADRIRVQIWPGSGADREDFTAAALVYTR